jgi:hypothetical protein
MINFRSYRHIPSWLVDLSVEGEKSAETVLFFSVLQIHFYEQQCIVCYVLIAAIVGFFTEIYMTAMLEQYY